MAISMNLSRISPMSCFTYIISELSSTGIADRKKFHEHALRFQNTVNQEIYDNYITKTYRLKNSTSIYGSMKEGVDRDALRNRPAPQLEYTHVSIQEALKIVEAPSFCLQILFRTP